MQLKLPVEDASHVAEARRECIRIAERAGFSEADAGRVALVATELATNLLKHASNGILIAGLIEAGPGYAVQILSLDKGNGIPDLAAASRDGFSTAGTPGNGLGALRRLSDIFEVSTAPGDGTAMLAVLYASRSQGHRRRLNWGAVSIAKHGEEVCGDAWVAVSEGSRTTVLVADGLGHGYAAHEAAQEAVRIFREQAGAPVEAIVAAINAGLKKTRGAAVSIARIDYERGLVTYAGIGNVAGAIFAEEFGSQDGIPQRDGRVGRTPHSGVRLPASQRVPRRARLRWHRVWLVHSQISRSSACEPRVGRWRYFSRLRTRTR